MSNTLVKTVLIATMTAVLALASCSKSEEPPAPPPAQAQAQAPATAAPESAPGAAPGLVASHAPLLGGAEPAGGATPGAAGAPPAAMGTGRGPSPHGEIHWDAPETWKPEKPSSPMRMAQYRVPAAAGDAEDGECVVFYFGPGQGGDAQSNVSRWAMMFTKPDGSPADNRVSEQKVGERLVTRVEAAGTYHPTSMSFGGAPPPPKPGYMLLGAIVPGGDANWFFRCTGPEKTIGAGKPGFDALLKSIR